MQHGVCRQTQPCPLKDTAVAEQLHACWGSAAKQPPQCHKKNHCRAQTALLSWVGPCTQCGAGGPAGAAGHAHAAEGGRHQGHLPARPTMHLLCKPRIPGMSRPLPWVADSQHACTSLCNCSIWLHHKSHVLLAFACVRLLYVCILRTHWQCLHASRCGARTCPSAVDDGCG
jgi:hypothetical protein